MMEDQKRADGLLLAFKYILDFYYGSVEIETINTVLAHDKSRTEVDDLRYGAKDFGLNFEEAEFDRSIIESHILPCIVIKDNHAKILLSLKEGYMELRDPVSKELERLPLLSEKDSFDKLLYFYKDPEHDGILTHEKKGKEWFWRHLFDAKPDIKRVAALTLFINIFIIITPLYTMNVYNRVIPNFAIDTLFVLTVGVIIIFIFDAIFKSARAYLLEFMGKRIGAALEEELLKKLLLLQAGHDHLLAGSKANLFKEISQVREFFMSKSIAHALDIPFVFLTVTVIFIISVPVGITVLLFCIAVVAVNFAVHTPVFALSRKLFRDGQLKHNYLFETIKGIETIKLANANTQRLFRWRQIVGFYNHINLKIQMYTHSAANISQLLIQTATVVALVVGVYQVGDKNLTIGALVALGILVGRAMAPIAGIAGFLSKYKDVNESLSLLDKFWHLPLETDKNINFGVKKLKGDIEFQNVSFTYSGTKHPTLNGVSFRIKAGEKVGFIGRTGAGKSTIMRLLSALDTQKSGSIFIDGHDINTIHPVELRDSIGVMPQEPFLFAGTLKENIELGRRIGKESLIKLLSMTGLLELVKRSGQGENFQVGEGGSRLSVGQRHLVGLARALINDPNILILDEPTSGMDVGLEREMVEHLKTLAKDKTLIVITHRFAALELVDRVLVVNNGKIVADGPRDVILKQLQTPTGRQK